MSKERDRLERAKAKMDELTLGREYDAAWRVVLSALEAAEARVKELEEAHWTVEDRLYAEEAKRLDAEAENEALRAERERGLWIAHELTLETQTVEEACASLVDLVRKARAERDRLRDGKLWLVWSIEHGCWWATDSLGYRGTVEAAGRYTLAEAVRISRLRSPFVDRYGKSHRAEMPIPSPELCALFGVDWDGRALASGEESRHD